MINSDVEVCGLFRQTCVIDAIFWVVTQEIRQFDAVEFHERSKITFVNCQIVIDNDLFFEITT